MLCGMSASSRDGQMNVLVRVMAMLMVWLSLVLALPSATQAQPGGSVDGDDPTVASAVSAGVSDSVVRLYGAVFDRQPDAAGFAYWVDRYVSGTPLAVVARSFMEAPEWAETYGEVGDTEFIELLYRNVLDREPDASGAEYWAAELSSGLSRVHLLLNFSESPEFIEVTGTSQPEAPPPLFPALPAGAGAGRRVVYSNSEQRVWWVEENEVVVQSYAVSGRRGVPRPGTYRVFSKSPVAWAGHDGITMNHMVRFARGTRLAIGFHSIPRYANGTPLQTEAELGGYRSAGCVRQADADAAALYEWAEIGTTVVVTP